MPSFDIVSKVDVQEVDNAVNQTRREMSQRYDFKGSRCELEWDKSGEMKVSGESENRLNAVIDILQARLVKRGVDLKALDYGPVEDASGGTKRQTIKLRQGIPQDKGKEINKLIKELKLKVQGQIQGDQVRVTGKKIDDLQAVIQALKARDLGLPLQFINMRS
ncbi:MAG: YajQ family cyclic di-GMP-binding protein [Thermodesulfobacteriota bacterium]